jgi:hypothetical protein
MRKPYKKRTWTAATAIYGAIDVIQELIDLGLTEFFAIPEAVNEVADVFIGISQAVFFWYGGAISLNSCIALIVTFLTEEATAGGAPFWFLDVIYAQRNAPPPEEEQAAAIAGAYMAKNNPTSQAGPVNQKIRGNNVRIPNNERQKPLNIRENGVSVRPPTGAQKVMDDEDLPLSA